MDKKENNQKREYPRFLDNKPCGKDLFEGKSHDSVAQNIANIIANSEAKIVGIDGGWGSGKSNMVNLVKEKLNSDKYHFFIYDAWGHQTDFQRRSILENLTGFLVDDARILNKKKWDAKLLQLLSRKRSVGSKIVKELSAIAKVSAIIALAMPLLVLISGFINNNTGRIVYWAALFVAAIICLFAFQIKNMKKYGQTITPLKIVSELFLSYMDYTNEKSKDSIEQMMKYETIYDEEPSTRDFKNWMHEIDTDIKSNRLIIIFDNMDRLPRNKVQELWASIHTFFAEDNYNNISVIVPFDREHIKSAFKSEDIVSDQKGQGSGTETNKMVCFGNDFINKTFDAVYRVSPPILSDWKSYFANRWEEAFGAELDNRVTQIYDLLSDVITPREIVAFINEFVSIKQISDTSIPDEYVALFIKGKDIISAQPQKEILNPSYLGAMDFMYKDDKMLPKYISALYYQLPADKALDVVYTEELKRALDNADFKQIEVIQNQLNVFYSVLDNAITKINNVPNATTSLKHCFDNESNEHIQRAWDCIYEIEKKKEIMKPLQEYQKLLIQNITNREEYLRILINRFYTLSDSNVIGYYNSIQQLSEIDGLDPFKYLEEKEVDAETFVEFVKQAKEKYKQYKIVCSQEKLDEYLSGLDVDQLSALNVIPVLSKEFDVTAYLKHLHNLVDLNQTNKEKLGIIFDRLKEIERPITKSLPDVQLQTLFGNTKETEGFYYDLICMRISRLKKLQVNIQNAFNPVMNKSEEDFVEKVAERIEYYISYGDVLLNVENMNYPLYKAVAIKLTEKSFGPSNMDVAAVIQKYDVIKNNLGITPEVFIKRIDTWGDDVQKRITEDNVSSIPVEFFNDIKTIDSNMSSYCIKIAESYLNSKSKEEWKQSILAGNYEYQLLMIIKPDIQACFDAFKELLVENVQANNSAFSKDKCGSLIELSESNGREMLAAFNNVRDCFCGGTYIMTNDIFSFYGEWLLKYAKLEEKPSALRTIFTTAVLDNTENIQLILKYQEKMVKIVEVAGDENNDFKGKIKSLLDGEFKDDDGFEGFAKAIGINKSIIDRLKDSIGI